MTLSTEDWEAFKSNDGYIIYLDGEATPVGIGFDFQRLDEVFDYLVKEKGVEETARILGYDSAEEMVLDMANFLGNGDYTIDDLVLDGCDGKLVEDIDYEAEAADHKADELAGR